MIPAIGYMIGTYIFTRMVELLATKEAPGVAKAFAVVTIIVTAVMCAALASAEARFP